VRFGVQMFLTDRSIRPDHVAREAEARGFDSMFIPEHTHIPTARTTPAPMGEPLPDYYHRCLDPFVALTAAAQATERLRVGTAVCLVAQRDPFVTAKEVATLDWLSGGRFVFGVGFGWNRDELEDHGVAYADRRDVTRERLLAMRELWTNDEGSFQGDHVRFGPSWAWPKPAAEGGPPLFVGGQGGPKLFAHVAEYADGWMPIGGRGVAKALPVLRELYERNGRDPASLQIVPVGSIPEAGKLEYFAGLGIEEVVLGVDHGPPDHVLPILDEYAKLVEPFRS
jgi:probable F420-dependent oxidoreductase